MDAFARISRLEQRLEIRESVCGSQKSLHALIAFAPGDILSRFDARSRHRHPSVHTVQVSECEHIQLEPESLKYTNHSCAPNVVFDVKRSTVTAIRAIAPGDEIVYFYPSTEVSMAQPFVCRCGAPECLGIIAGADSLDPDVLARYSLAGHVHSYLAAREIARAEAAS